MRSLVATVTRWIRAALDWLSDLVGVLKLCRFSGIVVLFVTISLVFVGQVQEALRGLGETEGRFLWATFQWVVFLIAAIVLAFNAWYWARFMFYLPHEEEHKGISPKWTARFKAHVPRILGCLVLLACGIGLFRSAAAYWSSDPRGAGVVLNIMGVVCVLLAVGFFFVVYFRTRVLKNVFGWEPIREPVEGVVQLGRPTKVLLLISFGLSLFWFVLFTFASVGVAPWIGSASILFIAMSSWLPIGSFLVYLARIWRCTRLLSVILVAAILFSFWNDNHHVRELRSRPAARRGNSTEEFAGRWLTARDGEANGKEIPVFLVAAAGGGVRAAYWTAIVLGELEDKSRSRPRRFGRHTFAVSGVSGGSLGGAVFAALVADDANDARRAAGEILARDFLSPTIAAMLFQDLFQRFLPFPVGYFDRARSLEKAWESAWEREQKNDRFARRFGDLWQSDEALAVPALFLNGTNVATGKRMVMSNLSLSSGFEDVFELQTVLRRAVPLSTAVDMSTRFPYVSPAGRIDAPDSLFIVDGGYFENSGAATLLEVLQEVQRGANARGLSARIVPIVIVISNDPEQPDEGVPTASEVDEGEFLKEATAPLSTMLSTRDARGHYAEAAIKTAVLAANGKFIRFRLRSSDVPLPLGWMISDSARNEMERQLEAENASSVAEVLEALE